MRLAFTIFKYFPFGGLQLDFRRILEEGLRRGHSITVIYDTWEGAFIPGAEYHPLPVSGRTNWGRARCFERLALAYLAGEHFDLTVGFNRMKGLDVYFAADNCFAEHARGKSCLTRLFAPRYRVFERMERAVFAADGAATVLYLVEAQKKSYQSCYRTPDSRFRPLPPGIGKEFVCPEPEERQKIRLRVRREWNIDEETPVLLQICSAFHTKGVDRVLEAASGLPETADFVYLVAGREKPGRFARLAEKYGMARRVHFIGGRSDIPDLLAASDLMVHPARNEATGTVLAEAVACGLPAVCSGNCGYAPMVESAGGLVLPEPFAASALREILERLLTRPALLADWRNRAAEHAKTVNFGQRAECAMDRIEETRHV